MQTSRMPKVTSRLVTGGAFAREVKIAPVWRTTFLSERITNRSDASQAVTTEHTEDTESKRHRTTNVAKHANKFSPGRCKLQQDFRLQIICVHLRNLRFPPVFAFVFFESFVVHRFSVSSVYSVVWFKTKKDAGVMPASGGRRDVDST